MRIAIAFMLAAGALVLAGCGGGGGGTTTKAPRPARLEITVKGGKPVGGIQRLTVKKGDVLEIVVHSDISDEVHLHGYDKHVNVGPGGPSIMHFDPDIPGVFVIELEHRGLQLGELTVK